MPSQLKSDPSRPVASARLCNPNSEDFEPRPNVKENPRNRRTPKRGRKRLFNAAIHSLRLCVERTFAWEDKFKRLLLRFEFKQQRHYGMKLMAYTLINLRPFCGA
jgi:transposase